MLLLLRLRLLEVEGEPLVRLLVAAQQRQRLRLFPEEVGGGAQRARLAVQGLGAL